ncbi:MAG: DUF4124 domain-containing protein [Deltaproteobacteria bacterium]|nr:DUF4124 domain-containing protein [Deltaproteobacteria bacterium]
MKITILVAFLVSLSLISSENICAQSIYKWVDEKGTVHFSDSPTTSSVNKEKETSKENGLEVLKKLEEKHHSQAGPTGGGSSSGAVSSGSSGGKTTSRPVRS